MAEKPFLSEIDRVLVDASVNQSLLAARVRKKLPEAQWQVLEKDQDGKEISQQSRTLYLRHFPGRFLRNCPGTAFYRCCGYQIVHIGENCPLSCSYCILQGYFQDSLLKVWANQQDLFREFEQVMHRQPGRRFRLGTGEFTDSLALESVTGYTQDLLRFLQDFPQACLELKSKIVDLSWMQAVRRPWQVLPAWSLNAPVIQREHEPESAGLEERLKAAACCVQQGFRVCLHFDPLIYYPGWEEGYRESVQMIFDYLRPEQIAYLSLGSLRCMPQLKAGIEARQPGSRLFCGEYVRGLDGKLRLLRPLRVQQFKFMADLLKARRLQGKIYLCMESDEVWRAALGYTPRDLGGLQKHLLQLAFAG